MERVRQMRSRSSEGDAVQAVEKAGVEVYLGHTRFTAPNVVEVDGRQLRFRKAVIATGADGSHTIARPLSFELDILKPQEVLSPPEIHIHFVGPEE
jgi:pyruvate/2-oxoglutarate dehydrogenase complex dihydrolipoamide dehydrogenase (E3) component